MINLFLVSFLAVAQAFAPAAPATARDLTYSRSGPGVLPSPSRALSSSSHRASSVALGITTEHGHHGTRPIHLMRPITNLNVGDYVRHSLQEPPEKIERPEPVKHHEPKKIIPPSPPSPTLPVSIPVSIRVRQGQLIRITAKSPSPVTWQIPKTMALPADYEELADNRLILPSDKPGKWIVQAWAVVGMKAVASNECVIEITGVSPIPPVPPVPPGPVPPLPEWKAALLKAYQKDVAANAGGEEFLTDYAALYAEAAFAADGEDYKTVGEVSDYFRRMASSYFSRKPGKLIECRKHLDARLGQALPEKLTTLATVREQVVGAFREIELGLQELARGPPDPPVPPGPTPRPAPIPEAGLHILFVYETGEHMSAEIQSIIFGKDVENYIRSKSGKLRRFDPDVVLAPTEQVWIDALKRPRSKLPWLIISNGKEGYEGVLPESVEEAMTLLKKYGGE